MKKISERCRVAMLGQAIGDAFGAPFEYNRNAPELAQLSLREQRFLDAYRDCGARARRSRLPGLYTDDTQQAILLVLAWKNTDTPEDAAAWFMDKCVEMANDSTGSFGVHRGTGGNFRTAVTTGRPPDTAGIGAAMRVGPVATLFDDPQEMIEWVLEVSSVTTSNPIALASAAKFAAVAWATARPDLRHFIRQVDWPEDRVPSEVWKATTAALRTVKNEGEAALCEFATMTGWPNKPMTCAANGFALTGFAWAVNCGLGVNSIEVALAVACQSGGDTDTVGAMAGCLSALKTGAKAIPGWMVDGVGEYLIVDPVDVIGHERKLTRLEVEHRNAILAEIHAAQKATKVRRREDREQIDFFDLAAEAEEDEALANDPGPVLFGNEKGSVFDSFSNFYPAKFTLDGEVWPDTEHYFMAQKNPDDANYQAAIRSAATPARAKHLGRQVKLREGWDNIKRDVMFRCVRAKFEQNPELRALLLSTGDRDIHEDRPDPWWGGGPNFPDGRDWLGQVLMDVRDILRGGG